MPPESSLPVVLVTGSTGLIGSQLVERLASDYRVVGLDVKPPRQPIAGTEWIECDMTDDGSVRQALARMREQVGGRLASVVHLAAYYDFSGEPSPLYDTLTVQGTRRLLQEMQSFEVEQLIFSSSLLVMKPVDTGDVLTEDSPTQGEWDYPQSKLRAEEVLRGERGKIPVVIVRLAGIYDDLCHSIPIAQQIKRIYEKDLESYFFPGDPEHGQSFVHMDDALDCFEQIIFHRNTLSPYEVFLIGEPGVVSYAEMQEELGYLIHGKEWPAIRIPKTVAKVGAWVQDKLAGEDEAFIKPWMIDLADQHYPVSIAKANQLLGWNPRHDLRDALDQMVRRLQEDPRRWYEINKLTLPAELEKQ
jgi:nucleoside-diphosphate-sugar epimerase